MSTAQDQSNQPERLRALAADAALREEARQRKREEEKLEKNRAATDSFLSSLPERLNADGEARYSLPEHVRNEKELPEAARYLWDLLQGLGLVTEIDVQSDTVGYSVRTSVSLVVRLAGSCRCKNPN